MPQLDALGMTEDIRHRLVELAVSENFFRDPELSNKCREIWSGDPNEGGLVGELWVEGAFPSKLSDLALDDLAGDLIPGEVVDLLNTQQAVPRNRKLYTHQVEALNKTGTLEDGTKPAVIVSSGTGSGKTEAFLLPLLREIWKSKRSTSGRKGARCIILYPMNALVADQVDRLYDWLKPQEGDDPITVFHFTSETPDNRRLANSIGEPYWSRCRMRTRQEARGLETHGFAPDKEGADIPPDRRTAPPDILITNYSMLEYMLCRPQDQVFFGEDLECVVLDEAHLYTEHLQLKSLYSSDAFSVDAECNPKEFCTSQLLQRLAAVGMISDILQQRFSPRKLRPLM